MVGAGSIGVGWAVVFACAGRSVRLVDLDATRLAQALDEAAGTIALLEGAGLTAEATEVVLARIEARGRLEDAVTGVGYVQECIVEDLSAKKALFVTLDALTARDVVLASSTSTITASLFAADLPGRERCLVVHPGNPPYVLRVAEIVPAPFTSQTVVDRASLLIESVQMAPVLLRAEIEGFVFNRLQGALLREAYCLVRDGLVSPVDLDTIVREGLGQRWSVLGPFATSEVNTRGGLRRHAELHGRVYARLGIERAREDPWTPETVDLVATDIQRHLPHEDWAANVRERDTVMITLAALRRGLDNPLAPTSQHSSDASTPAADDTLATTPS